MIPKKSINVALKSLKPLQSLVRGRFELGEDRNPRARLKSSHFRCNSLFHTLPLAQFL